MSNHRDGTHHPTALEDQSSFMFALHFGGKGASRFICNVRNSRKTFSMWLLAQKKVFLSTPLVT